MSYQEELKHKATLKELRKGILYVSTDPVKYCWLDSYNRLREGVYRICIINGDRWIAAGTSQWLKRLQNENLIDDTDILHVITDVDFPSHGRDITQKRYKLVIKLNSLLSIKDKVLKYISDYYLYDALRWTSILKDAGICEVKKSYTFTQEIINASEEASRKSKELTAQRRKEKSQPTEEETSPSPDKTLQELVSQIEAMGWEVTLKLKETG